MKTRIKGIIPPIVTPFDADGVVDERMLRENIRFQLSRGVHGVCFGGSTGEGHTLTSDELVQIAEICVEEAGGRVPVVAGIITNSTRDAAQKAKRMAACGVDALQITPVHYLFKPDENATYSHFATLGDATDLPILIYNVIAWNYISPALLVRMMHDIPNVKGVKQSAGDLKLMADLLVSAPQDTIVLSILCPGRAWNHRRQPGGIAGGLRRLVGCYAGRKPPACH
jgi:4-hydroxy-tetrahydrodipicolinate synthase